MLIEIHMLKNYSPTNLNRDDTGAPKSCIFGGVQRGRISSQCMKRSWRKSPILQKEVGESLIGIRTRKMPELVSAKLREMGVDEDYLPDAEAKLTGVANKEGKENTKGNYTAQIVIYSPEDIACIAEHLKEKIDESGSVQQFKKLSIKDFASELKKTGSRPVTLDIALFGRMVTSDAFANVEASMQVAHAVSTNKVIMETDFFAAVDDLIDGMDETGSAMIGDIDYNSSCYYIYASVDTDKLAENLKSSENPSEIVRKTIPALLRTIAYTNPSGKQNSFAGNSLPSAVLVECKDYPVPVSYANAFVKPIYPQRDSDLVYQSTVALADYVKETSEKFDIPTKKRLWFCAGTDVSLDIAENCQKYEELVGAVSALLAE